MSIMSNRVQPTFAASRPAMTPRAEGSAPLVAPAIDFGHLARQSLGDQALEVELMQLFDRQAARIAAELGMPDLAKGSRAERGDLAHTLKGSARAIGAWRVADACEAYENALKSDVSALTLDALAVAVGVEVEQARRLIAETVGR